MRRLFAGMLCTLLLLAAGCTLVVSGCEMNGRVVDSETGAPIPGALVIAEWTGDIGGPVQSSQVCFHMEVAKTDAEGRYHIPGWSRRPVTDTEGGFFGIRNVEVSRRTYKAGYEQLRFDANDSSTILMKPVNAFTIERLKVLSKVGTSGCGSSDGSLVKEVTVWQAVCEEVRGYSVARLPQQNFGNHTFIQLINDQLSGISRQLAANQQTAGAIDSTQCN